MEGEGAVSGLWGGQGLAGWRVGRGGGGGGGGGKRETEGLTWWTTGWSEISAKKPMLRKKRKHSFEPR